jgi:hypothetical protein
MALSDRLLHGDGDRRRNRSRLRVRLVVVGLRRGCCARGWGSRDRRRHGPGRARPDRTGMSDERRASSWFSSSATARQQTRTPFVRVVLEHPFPYVDHLDRTEARHLPHGSFGPPLLVRGEKRRERRAIARSSCSTADRSRVGRDLVGRLDLPRVRAFVRPTTEPSGSVMPDRPVDRLREVSWATGATMPARRRIA